MNAIFVDTWAWYALLDTADSDHLVAQLANEELVNAGYAFVTTNFVVDETLTLIRYHLDHATAVRFWNLLQELIESRLVTYVHVAAEQEAAAWAIFEKYNDQLFSFTDCMSFAVMQSMQLIEAFTGDQHFRIMGFLLKP